MASKHEYDSSFDALLHPAKNAAFFQGWDPNVDNRDHDLLCAEMSRLAYAAPDVVQSSLAQIGFDSVELIGGEDTNDREELLGTQGFVARSPRFGLTVVAFRGTESDKFEDLIADGKSLQKEWPQHAGCLVHAGFADCWDCVSDRVAHLLASREGTLPMTGHSLGAALATLAAIEAKPDALVTFGSPLVGIESWEICWLESTSAAMSTAVT